jgi:integrase
MLSLINFALQLVLNGALRDKEARTLKWSQIDFLNIVRRTGDENRNPGEFVLTRG